MGRRKSSVFPEPVWAQHSVSSPRSSRGSPRACNAFGSCTSMDCSAATMSELTSDRKLGLGRGGLAGGAVTGLRARGAVFMSSLGSRRIGTRASLSCRVGGGVACAGRPWVVSGGVTARQIESHTHVGGAAGASAHSRQQRLTADKRRRKRESNGALIGRQANEKATSPGSACCCTPASPPVACETCATASTTARAGRGCSYCIRGTIRTSGSPASTRCTGTARSGSRSSRSRRCWQGIGRGPATVSWFGSRLPGASHSTGPPCSRQSNSTRARSSRCAAWARA